MGKVLRRIGMRFSIETLSIGGKIVIPHSFVNTKDEGEIFSKTKLGINVIWFKGTANEQLGFYSYGWLNQMYAEEPTEVKVGPSDNSGGLDDEIPF